MRSQIYLRSYLIYGFTARFSIKVVVVYCSNKRIFATEYHIYGRRNEELMGGNPSRPVSKGIYYSTGFRETQSFVTIAGLHLK
jgi:hypothetical protein